MKSYLIALGLIVGIGSVVTWSRISADAQKPAPNPPKEKVSPPKKSDPIPETKAPKPKFAKPSTPPKQHSEEDLSKEESLTNALRESQDFSKIADIEELSCDGKTCYIKASAHEETNEKILMGIITFLQKNPGYGTRFSKDDIADDPKSALITITE